ncbi:MAG: type IX secretion system membrane protein PorP/SprF [Saprospiraceae bacterium]|nr:type IX secretion system membrane protein PorP/SprF [Saprospiraceae bacterium]MCB9312119.1 type IX secretion system membrane protein PorP/SprF [Lewinellaceae bacterium]HRW75912.1 type IX secretion system membrane protein PorP/SprF [Saprospiraceae bacterium]
MVAGRQTILFDFLFCLFMVMGFSYNAFGQDPVFSQYYSAPLQTNPAFAGNTNLPRIGVHYRNQWPNLPNAYATYMVTYDQFVPMLNSGFGITAMGDIAGDGIYKTVSISGLYSYRVEFAEDVYAKIGIEGSYLQRSLDWNRLVFYDQLDPVYGPNDPSGNPNPTGEGQPEDLVRGNLDVSAGLLVYSRMFYAGFSMNHLTTPDESFLQINDNLYFGLPVRLSFMGGAQFNIDNNRDGATFLSPNVLYTRQGGFSQLNAGLYGQLGLVFAGAWYRHAGSNADAVIGLVGVQQGILKVGYSYDLTVSGASGFGGAHEISLILNFDNSASAEANRRRGRYSDCLKMFR